MHDSSSGSMMMRPAERASRILLSDKITTKHPSERTPRWENLAKYGFYETRLSNAQSAATKPTAAMASDRLRGACGNDPSATLFGGFTMASTLPTHIAAPKASTNHARRSLPRNTISRRVRLRWSCPSPCFQSVCTWLATQAWRGQVDQLGAWQHSLPQNP